MTLSPPVKIVALIGVLLALGVGAFALMRVQADKTPAAPLVLRPVHSKLRTEKAARIESGIPVPLRTALAHHPIVVAVLDAPGIAGDSDAVSQARQGARAARAGFVVLNVRTEAVAEALATKAPNASDPSVLVVRRPGTIAVELDGYQDSETVAQAAVDARK